MKPNQVEEEERDLITGKLPESSFGTAAHNLQGAAQDSSLRLL
jgi:hypothetical protein